MQLEETLSSFVQEFGFSTEQQKEVTSDLMSIINIVLLTELSADENFKSDLVELEDLKSKHDYAGIESKFQELFAKDGFADTYKKIFSEVIRDWLRNIAGTLPEDKIRAILEKYQIEQN